MAGQVEDVDNALPYRLALKTLFDGHRLRQRSRPAVQLLDRAPQLSVFISMPGV